MQQRKDDRQGRLRRKHLRRDDLGYRLQARALGWWLRWMVIALAVVGVAMTLAGLYPFGDGLK